jgi:hypothetical protein
LKTTPDEIFSAEALPALAVSSIERVVGSLAARDAKPLSSTKLVYISALSYLGIPLWTNLKNFTEAKIARHFHGEFAASGRN